MIKKDAFKSQNGQTVPLVWNHNHDDVNDVLGLAHLENRKDGVYAYCEFNDTENGKTAKELVQHGDVRSLSIFANQLMQKGSDVIHGLIREVTVAVKGKKLKATATMTFDSTKVDAAKLQKLEGILYGTDGSGSTEPRLPMPDEIISMMITEG